MFFKESESWSLEGTSEGSQQVQPGPKNRSKLIQVWPYPTEL